MKKFTLLLFITITIFTNSFAQIGRSNCQNTCEVEKIIQKDAFMGVKIFGSRCHSEYQGVFIKEVLPNTAAEKFHFQVSDIILSIDGQKVLSSQEMIELIATYKPSDLVSISFMRDGEELESDVILGAKTTKIIKETICCDDNDIYFNDLNVTLYPNPAVNSVNLSMENAESGKYTFQVFNTVGAEVYVAIESFDDGFSKKINLSDLSSGEYFLKVSKGQNTITKTLAITK